MNDDELPINAELASAYLDGELAASERASAAADPEVVAVIESFAQLRAALGEIGPVVESTRTAAIAAALAEFDAMHASNAAAAATATITSLQSRRMRGYRVVMGVAAAAVIGVVAIAALNSTRGNDNSSLSSGTAPAAAALPAETPQLKSTAGTAAAAATVAPSVAANSSTVQVPAIDTGDGLKQYAASFGLANAAAPAPTASTPASDQSVSAGTAAPAAGAAAPLPCLSSDQVVLGPIFFQGTSAFAVRLVSNDHIQAVDATDCRLLLDVAP
jgi:negative regulator of sigma E activity